MRLDVYLAEYWPEHSRAQWQKSIKDGSVQVNNKVVISPSFELGEDDEVKTAPPKQPDFSKKTLPILYEDDNVIVINKPVGILTQAKGALLDEFTVAEFIRGRRSTVPMPSDAVAELERRMKDGAESRNGGEGRDTNPRNGIVHRLDRDTSGVLICARSAATQSFLQNQFSLKKAKKTYLAIVEGTPKAPEAIIRLPIERNPNAPATFRVGPNGKPAETAYKVLWSDGSHALLELQPLTGRTHQLRVHMRYLGTPIMNDRFYNSKRSAGRLALHAWQLEITIPGGERKTFTAPVPDNFTNLLPSDEARQCLPS